MCGKGGAELGPLAAGGIGSYPRMSRVASPSSLSVEVLGGQKEMLHLVIPFVDGKSVQLPAFGGPLHPDRCVVRFPQSDEGAVAE